MEYSPTGMLRKLVELIPLAIAVGLTVEVIKPTIPYLPFIWLSVWAYYTWDVLKTRRVLNLARRIKDRLSGSRPMYSYVLVAVFGAALFMSYWWGLNSFFAPRIAGYEAEQHKKLPGEGENPQIRFRLGALLSEGANMQQVCQSVPNSYQTPPQARADLVNQIFNWQQRVEAALAVDPDPYVLQMWQKAILYGDPKQPPSVALHCTVLGVKMEALRHIINRKDATPQQIQARLQTFIDEANSLESFFLNSQDEQIIQSREIEWFSKVYEWLQTHMDESHAEEFNKAVTGVAESQSGVKIPPGLVAWKRIQERVGALQRILREVKATQQ
jgi:hypothetical protein